MLHPASAGSRSVRLRFRWCATPCLALALACGGDDDPDAYGTFEANEVVVSSQVGGQLLSFTPVEGARIAAGAVVGIVDTTQLALNRQQMVAQREAVAARATEAGGQITVLEVQRDIACRTYERTRRLFNQKAATAQQLDQAERDYRVLVAQIGAARAQRQSLGQEVTSGAARVEQIRDQIGRSRITNPEAGTVLATYVRAGEVVQPAQPVYRIANLDTLILRAYITESQLSAVRIGQTVNVHVDQPDGELITVPGTLTWLASKAEFTPTPVQTRDERSHLVYAVKVRVANPRGVLKIGMPADLRLTATATGT